MTSAPSRRTSLPATQRQWHLLGTESIELREVTLELPTGDDLLLEIEAATTCGTDLKVFRQGGHARMLVAPCPFGHEMAGRVAAVGPESARFAVGDRIVIANSASCGECLDCRRGRENLCADLIYLNGAFAQYLLVPERFVRRSAYRIPDRLQPELAALAEPLACAVHCLDQVETFLGACEAAQPPRGGLLEAATAVVYGAGPLGLMLIGLLARRGVQVLAADPNQARLDIATQFGARATKRIERTGNQSKLVLEAAATPDGGSWLAPAPPDQRGFDLAIDATGSPLVWADALRSVRRGGHVVFFGGTAPGAEIAVDARFVHYSEITLHGVYHHRPSSFERALGLLVEGACPFELLITERRPLEELDQALRAMAERTALKVALEATKCLEPQNVSW